MKPIITLFLFVLALNSASAQNELEYKSLDSFNNDTTAFFKYNFIQRANCYKGVKFEKVLEDINVPIKYIIPSFDFKMVHLDGISLYVQDGKTVSHMRRSKTIDDANYIIIIFSNPILVDENLKKLLKVEKTEESIKEVLDILRAYEISEAVMPDPVFKRPKTKSSNTTTPLKRGGYYLIK